MSHAAMMIPSLDRIGGAEQQAMLLATGLRMRGWRVSMVVLSGSGGAAAAELRDAGVGFVSLAMRKGLADPRGWIRLIRWLWREQPDVVHAHLHHAAWMARWSRLAAPVPVVIDTLHSSAIGRIGRRLGYILSRWCPDHVTAVSRATAESHRHARMVCARNLCVLPNGIDVKRWRPDGQARNDLRQALGLKEEFLWLAVGRLEPVKDYPTLLHALKRAPQTTQLAILGEGPERINLLHLTERLGLERRVHLIGFESKVQRWMQAADGFVLASLYEGLPMVLLEAGASALPAVATNVPGTREVILNGVTGWLTCADGADALAAVMTRLMRVSDEERRAMGERARQSVAERFSVEKVLDQWEALYTELLERRAMRGSRARARETLTRQSATEA
jgi:glycosyltransferase involved in cell wall biosynthesis